MQIDPKRFLRDHGFRHIESGDRGAYYTNGRTKIFVKKHFKEPGELRALLDQIREASRVKSRKLAEEAKEMEQLAEKQRQRATTAPHHMTPEEHRIAQMEAARNVVEQDKEVIAVEPTKEATKTGVKRPKLSGDERLYVFGRLRFMHSFNWPTKQIVEALNAEGVIQANGKPIDSTWVGGILHSWREEPKRKEKYAKILVPRNQAKVVEPVPEPVAPKAEVLPAAPVSIPEPVAPMQDAPRKIPGELLRRVVKEAIKEATLKPKYSRTERLMLSVLQANVSEYEKVKILRKWLED